MKNYTDEALAKDIIIMVNKKYTPKEIAVWAHEIYMKSNDHFTENGRDALQTLIAMDEGPEFELTEQDLKTLAKNLCQK